MRLDGITCSCGSNCLFVLYSVPHVGIYCTNCGKWIKWANKEERRIIELHNKSLYGKFTRGKEDYGDDKTKDDLFR